MNIEFTPAPCKTLYSAESGGWQVPEKERPADWQSREAEKPVVETKPAAVYMQSYLDCPPSQRKKPPVTKPGVGRPRIHPVKVPARRKVDGKLYPITATQAYERRKAGESAKDIAASVGCGVHWIFLMLRQAGFKEPRTCLDCPTDISTLAANANRCKGCSHNYQKKQKRDNWRKNYGKGLQYKAGL